MAGHVALGKLDIDVMEQSRHSPFVLVTAHSLSQGAHDGLRGQHVFNQVFVLHVLTDGLHSFLSVHLMLLFLIYNTEY